MSSSETLEYPPTGHWCVSQEDTAVSFCRTRGFKFSPRTPRKRALRDTEGVYEISLRAIRPLIVRNTLETFYLWGSTLRPHAEGIYKNSKILWNLYGYLIQKQPSQPFCVRRAPSEPASVASVVIKLFFFFSPRKTQKRALRDTERVNEFSLRITRPQFVRNFLDFYLWGCTPDPRVNAQSNH